MIVSVSENNDEIELSGNAKELDFLSKQLIINESKIALEYENLNPSPYDKNLKSILIKHITDEFVKINVEGDSLLITGDFSKLKILSENIEMNENELKDYHIHIEYFDGHLFLSKNSIPLVVNWK